MASRATELVAGTIDRTEERPLGTIDQAKAAADKVRRAAVLVAFVTAASLVVRLQQPWWVS